MYFITETTKYNQGVKISNPIQLNRGEKKKKDLKKIKITSFMSSLIYKASAESFLRGSH